MTWREPIAERCSFDARHDMLHGLGAHVPALLAALEECENELDRLMDILGDTDQEIVGALLARLRAPTVPPEWAPPPEAVAKCESCLGVATKTCGYDDQPMLNFCVPDYIQHLRAAHPENRAAQREADELEFAMKEADRGK